MHAFILGKDVGFSAERFYGGVADLLAGVEEEEGYVIDGKWVGWGDREGRKKRTVEAEAASDKAGGAGTIRRTASDKERWRMEEILRSTPSPPPSRSSLSSSPEESARVHLEVQTRHVGRAVVEGESSQDCDLALKSGNPRGADKECIMTDVVPDHAQVRRPADSQERAAARSSREVSNSSFPRP